MHTKQVWIFINPHSSEENTHAHTHTPFIHRPHKKDIMDIIPKLVILYV